MGGPEEFYQALDRLARCCDPASARENLEDVLARMIILSGAKGGFILTTGEEDDPATGLSVSRDPADDMPPPTPAAMEAFVKDKKHRMPGARTLTIPVRDDGVLTGLIHLHSVNVSLAGGYAGPLERHLITLAARLAHHRKMLGRLETLQTVSEVGTIISAHLELRELTRAVVEHLGRVIPNDRVNIVLYREQERTLEFIASFISGEYDRGETETYRLSDGMNSWIVRTRKPLLIREDTVKECEELGIRHGGKPAKSWLGVPLVHRDRIVGVLSVQAYDQPQQYDERSVEMLTLVAGQVAVAVENALLYEAQARRETEKQRIYFSLTHDLVSLINPVSGFGDIIERLAPDDFKAKKNEIGASLKDTARKITRFVDDILFFSKLESGTLEPDKEPVDFYTLVESALANFRAEIELRDMTVTVDGHDVSKNFPGELHGRTVTCDPGQIERVLNNCLQNSLKHSARTIHITTESDDGQLHCTLDDDGTGMAAEDVGKVFDEYFQADNRKKGVGLGLPSVKRIIEEHGGSVAAASEKGKGFSFTFSLPL